MNDTHLCTPEAVHAAAVCQDFTPDAAKERCTTCGVAVEDHVPSVMYIAAEAPAPPRTLDSVSDPTPAVAETGLPHGYASDVDALRAVVDLYSGASADALLRFYEASAASRYGSPVYAVTLARYRDLNSAHSALVTKWASTRASGLVALDQVAKMIVGGPTKLYEARWTEVVVADVLTRLDGDMGRPIPEYPKDMPLSAADHAAVLDLLGLAGSSATPTGAA